MKIYALLILNLFILNIFSKNLREEVIDDPILKMSEIEYSGNNGVFEIKSDSVITQISWTKKDSYKYNYLLGVFEGASDSSFSDAVPIAIIKDQEGSDHYVDVKVPKFYKYL
jgi:hypothetical protein